MKLLNHRLHNNPTKGFTFTEILIVLAIIAGVTVLVLSQADTAVGASEISRTQNVIRIFATAATHYRAIKGTYADMDVEAIIDLGLLPQAVHNGTHTITPYNDDDGIRVFDADNGKKYLITLDFGYVDDSAALTRQLHEGLGGYDAAKIGSTSVHEGTDAAPAALLAVNVADNQYWAREFD